MSSKIVKLPDDLSPDSVDKIPFEDFSAHSRINLVKSALHCTDPSRCVASAADETDINRMVAGLTPFTQTQRQPFYIDETVFADTLEQHRDALENAYDAFMELDPRIREEFGNDPANLAAALGDPAQRDRLTELGLLPGANDPAPLPEPSPAPADPKGSGDSQ